MPSEFALWARLTHFFNFLFITLLIRSGIEIIGAEPKFYTNHHSLPGSEWLWFTNTDMPDDELWTSEDESRPLSSWIALPGQDNLGLGRHWHFWAVCGWLLTGLLYIVLLFTSGEWHRLIPTSWSIFPQAWHALVEYLQFNIPHTVGYNGLQKLSYFGVVFILTPLQILTGLAMSPTLDARFPRFTKVFGGRQTARSLHLVGMVLFIGFTLVHVGIVVIHGFGTEMAKIVLGNEHANPTLAIVVGLIGIGAVVGFHIVGTWYSLRSPRKMKNLLEIGVDPLRLRLFHHWSTVQQFDQDEISEYARVNGRPPKNDTYQQSKENDFEDWELQVDGLVETPLTLSLDELQEMPRQEQTTKHICIQGWSYIASWGGVPVSEIVERCNPTDDAEYLVFHTKDEKWEYSEEGPEEDVDHGNYYEVIDMEEAMKPETILADEMNGDPLPVPHGGPLRLRLETQLGFRMAKWVDHIEFVEDYEDIRGGQGGWRNDVLQYSSEAGI